MVSNIFDENIEKISPIASPDTFVRLLTLGIMFPVQMNRWIPHAFSNWSQNLNRVLWFDIYLILSSAKRFFAEFEIKRFVPNVFLSCLDISVR